MQFNQLSDRQQNPASPPVHRHRHGPRTGCRYPPGQAIQLRNRSDFPDRRETRRSELCNTSYGLDPSIDTALRINADHARATAFLVNDGVLPSNEGRGYVLRKIMRRAMRNARLIGKQEPYLYELTGFVAEHMAEAYPEMRESVQRVARIVKDEEHRYATTFLVAEKVFHDELSGLTGKFVPGTTSFKLYDTYGLALDEQEDMARERGFEDRSRSFRNRNEAAGANAPAPAGEAATKATSPPPTSNSSPRDAPNSSSSNLIAASSMPRRKSIGHAHQSRNSYRQARLPMSMPKWCSIRPPSTPKPADRSAIMAVSV